MFTLELITNTDCNLTCYYCFAKNKCNKPDPIPYGVFSKAIDLSWKIIKKKKINKMFFKLYGGETLLYQENILNILRYIEKTSLKNKDIETDIAIINNGTVIDEDFCINAKNICINSRLSYNFSLEYSEDGHNEIRKYKNGKGSFEDFFKNVISVSNVIGKPNFQTVLSPDMLENIDSYIEMLEKYKSIGYFGLVPMMDSTFTRNEKTIKNLRILFDYYIDCFLRNDFEHLSLFQVSRSIISCISNKKKTSHCQAGSDYITIMPNGDLYPCVNFYHNKLFDRKYGNVLENLKEAEDVFFKQCKMYEILTMKNYHCITCEIENNIGCLGQCIANKLAYNNLEPYESICKHNIEFGKEVNRMIKALSNKDNFVQYMKRYASIFKDNQYFFKLYEERINGNDI